MGLLMVAGTKTWCFLEGVAVPLYEQVCFNLEQRLHIGRSPVQRIFGRRCLAMHDGSNEALREVSGVLPSGYDMYRKLSSVVR